MHGLWQTMPKSNGEGHALKAHKPFGISEYGKQPPLWQGIPNSTLFCAHCHSCQSYQHWEPWLQTDIAAEIHTESEMQQASDAMREALKGDSAASAAISDMDRDAALEMVRTGCYAAFYLMQ